MGCGVSRSERESSGERKMILKKIKNVGLMLVILAVKQSITDSVEKDLKRDIPCKTKAIKKKMQ